MRQEIKVPIYGVGTKIMLDKGVKKILILSIGFSESQKQVKKNLQFSLVIATKKGKTYKP